MLNLSTALKSRAEPIRVGLIGAGIFGSQLVYGIEETPGMQTVAIADLEPSKALNAYKNGGVTSDAIATVDKASEANECIHDGRRTILPHGEALLNADIDVVVEATGNPEIAAKHAHKALINEIHTVQVTVETDTVVGPYLARLAEQAGVTYTLAYGDQPAQIVSLCDWAESNGLEVVAAGRWANDPQPYGTPDDALDRHSWIGSFVDEYDPSPQIYNSFLDGTKMAVESCVSANAVGLTTDGSGLHMPKANLTEIPETLRLQTDGGILSQTGVIEAVDSVDVGHSVFVVTRTENPQRREYFDRRGNVPSANDGAYQLFYRHFHSASETTVSIAAAAEFGQATGVATEQQTEVVGRAKRDLSAGEEIDGAGGYTVYGTVEASESATEGGYVPFELLAGSTVLEDIDKDAILTYDDVSLNKDSFLYQLRQVQDVSC